MPSPERVRRDLLRAQKVGLELATLADELAIAYEESYEAGLRAGRGGDMPRLGSSFRKTDPTGDIAASADHRRIRGSVRFAARRARAARRYLEEAAQALHEAFLDTDPDLRRDRADKRAQVRVAVEELKKGA
jgi:hypothetical protein